MMLPGVIVLAAVSACSASAQAGEGRSSGSLSPYVQAGQIVASTAANGVSSGPSSSSTLSGYQRIGSTTLGLTFEVPKSWVPIDPSSQSVQQGLNKLHIKGMSTAQVTQAVQQVEKQHGVIVFDLQNAGTNINAYCTESGDNDTGSASVPFIEQAIRSQLGRYGAQDITQKTTTVGGVAGVQTSYHLPASGVMFYGGQLEVAPKPNQICFVTLTGSKAYFPVNDLSAAAATARFP